LPGCDQILGEVILEDIRNKEELLDQLEESIIVPFYKNGNKPD
jgi:hypothetical protein